MNFVKETLVGLPKTPTEKEFEVIKKQKAQEATKRIEEEKKSALEAKIKSESMKKQQLQFSKSMAHISNAVSKKQLFPVQTVVGSSKQLKNKDAKRIGQGFVASVAGQETIDDYNYFFKKISSNSVIHLKIY